MSFLLDTNVISEVRKRDKGNCGAVRWYEKQNLDELFISVLTTGEIRRGAEKCRMVDVPRARVYENWLRDLEHIFEDRILPVDADTADMWGRLTFHTKIPAIDGLIGATARHHGLIVATRNEADFQRMGVDYFNPFTGGKP